MAKSLPIVVAGFPCSIEAFLTAEDVPIEGWVYPQSARRQEAAGKLRRIVDSDGAIVGWHRIAGRTPTGRDEGARFAQMPVMERSACSISPSEMNAYAGRHFKGGRSVTKGLSEREREQREYSTRPLTTDEILAGKRHRVGKPPVEDFIERLEVKVESFAPAYARA